jgi:HD-GYP domain-containing protein (c-di-GMP phosphodiesterase class II)
MMTLWNDIGREGATLDGSWDILERFGLTLQQCDSPRDQIKLLLEAVADALGADAVLWLPGTGHDTFERHGDVPVEAAQADELLRQALARTASADRIAETFLDPGSKTMRPWPFSVAAVRISKTRGSYLVAASFHPRRRFDAADLKVMALARRMLLNHRQHAATYDKLRDSLFGLVRCLTASIDAKDPYTWGHSERVARIAVRLGKEMGLPSAFLSDLYLAGLLHDIGKIGVADAVLQKPGKLTDEEYEHIKQHVLIGDRLVSTMKPLAHLKPGVRNHHERWDGKGYPDGLRGEKVPLMARLLAVADGCDAMMAARPYRPALAPARIDAIMLDGAGTQWDPDLIAVFMTCRTELYSICQRGLGDSVFVAVERALQLGAGEESRKGGRG